MFDITNQNGITYDRDQSFCLTDMNGETGQSHSYSLNNMNGITWDDDILLSIVRMNPCRCCLRPAFGIRTENSPYTF